MKNKLLFLLFVTLLTTSFSTAAVVDTPESEYTFTIDTTDTISDTIASPDDPLTTDSPLAVINATPASGEVPLNVTFAATDSTEDITSYSWDFGDGSTAAGTVADHTYSIPGTYTATLLVIDQNGASHQVRTTISALAGTAVIEPPTAVISVISSNQPGGEAPVTISFDGSRSSDADGTIAQYNWNFGDGTTGSGRHVRHTYTTEGMYTVALTVTDDKGETATATSHIACNTSALDFFKTPAVFVATFTSETIPSPRTR